MDAWLKVCLLLCSYGFFKELRPSESFLTEYLLGPQHNLTESQVYFEVYPVWTYSYLSLLIVVFLLTDILRYKPVIIFEGIGYVATWSLLLWARGAHWMQFMEFCYGIATSTEVAYYTYIYAHVEEQHYQKVTSYTRCAILTGRFFSGFLSQILYSTGVMDYHTLNYFSLTSVLIALCIAIILPAAKTSIYFHRRESEITQESEIKVSEENNGSSKTELQKQSRNSVFKLINVKKAMNFLWLDFKEAYSNSYILKWSIWWSFATCVNFQVGNYTQPLWETILPFQQTEIIHNGSVEAAATLLGALAAFAVGFMAFNWTIFGELSLALISLIDAILLVFMGLTSNIWVCYISYILYRMSYQVLITVASFQVAKNLKAESYGLIFGINMFIALSMQSILTLIVIEHLEIEPRSQFVIYGCYLGCLSLLFFVFSTFTFIKLGVEGIKKTRLWEEPSPGTEPEP